MPLNISLKQFDGPLDLLLHLIGKAKIDIKDIFVSEITEQYIAFINEAAAFDMDEISAFLVMAATLIEIKSRSLLPKPPKMEEGEEDPEAALIRQLEEYKRFKDTADNLQAFEKAAAAMYEKLPEEYPLPPQSFELTDLSLEGLLEAFAQVLKRKPKQEELEELRHENRHIRRDNYTVQESMLTILRRLKKDKKVAFFEMLSEAPCKEEVVTLFLALLEILKLGKAHIEQERIYDTITLLPGRRKANAD